MKEKKSSNKFFLIMQDSELFLLLSHFFKKRRWAEQENIFKTISKILPKLPGQGSGTGRSFELKWNEAVTIGKKYTLIEHREIKVKRLEVPDSNGAGGGTWTPTRVTPRQILSLVRLPIPPLRHFAG